MTPCYLNNGKCPYEDFLQDMRRNYPADGMKMYMRLTFLQNEGDQIKLRGNTVSNLEDGENQIYALKANKCRIYYSFAPGRKVLLLNGCYKNQQKADPRQIALAIKVKKEHQSRLHLQK